MSYPSPGLTGRFSALQQGMAAPQLLVDSHEMVRKRVAEIIGEALDKIDNDLFEHAEKTFSRDEQRIYFDAMERVRKHRNEIHSGFDKYFRDIFGQKLTGSGGTAPPPPKENEWGGLELSLVSDSKVQDEINIDKLAQKVKNTVDPEEFNGIRARFGHLLAMDALGDNQNPILPEAVFEALKLSVDQVATEEAVKSKLLEAFAPYLSAKMGGIYKAVNANLIAHQVLPKIRHQVRSPSSHGGGGGGGGFGADQMNVSQKLTALAQSQMGRTGNHQALGRTGNNQALNALARSGGFQALSGALGAMAGAERSGWLGGGGPGAGEAISVSALLNSLLQGGMEAPSYQARAQSARLLADPMRFPEGQGAVAANGALMDALAEMQSQVNLGSFEVDEQGLAGGAIAPGFLAALQPEIRKKGNPLDQLTMEIVTVVFDFIFKDKNLPQTIKDLIARLQIVAVRAALLDRSFFARRQHPMRLLLDRISDAGNDPEIDSAPTAPFIVALRGIIDELVVGFETELSVFEAALSKVDEAVANEKARADSRVSVEAVKLEEEERRMVAEAAVRSELRRRVTANTPDFVVLFTTDWWSKALVESYLKDLQGEDGYAQRLGVVDALVWSVGPKTKSEIAELAAMLPKLVRSLVQGVAALGMPDEPKKAFMTSLMQHHTGTVQQSKLKPGEAVQGGIEPEVAAPPPPAPAAIEDIVFGASGAQVVTAPAPPPVPETRAQKKFQAAAALLAEDELDFSKASKVANNMDPFAEVAATIEKGAMIDITDDAASKRYRLTWISPKRTTFLLTSSVHGPRKMDEKEFTNFLRQGLAVIVDKSAALLDRAITAIVNEASAAPAPQKT